MSIFIDQYSKNKSRNVLPTCSTGTWQAWASGHWWIPAASSIHCWVLWQKLICIPTKENREIIFGVGRSRQTLTSLPSPSQELSVHQRLIFTSAEMHRGTKSFSQTNYGLGARVACPGPPWLSQKRPSCSSLWNTPEWANEANAPFCREGGQCWRLWSTLRDAEEMYFRISQELLQLYLGEGSKWFGKE